jgi:hypothetical protein
LAKFFLLVESKALVEIFLKMESKLIFDGPIFFYTRLFFGGLQVRPTVRYQNIFFSFFVQQIANFISVEISVLSTPFNLATSGRFDPLQVDGATMQDSSFIRGSVPPPMFPLTRRTPPLEIEPPPAPPAKFLSVT